MDDIESRLNRELKYLRRLGWDNNYAAHTIHLISILASFAASILAASELGKSMVTVAAVAAISGTLLAAHNMLKFKNKCGCITRKLSCFNTC